MPSDPSTVRAMLVLLENQGLVVREPHPSDARAKSVSLTSKGKKKFEQLWVASESIRQSMNSALNEKEYRILVKLLNQVTDALTNQTIEPVLGQGS
jgi:DNA-binding MarR family transcriptional regulator